MGAEPAIELALAGGISESRAKSQVIAQIYQKPVNKRRIFDSLSFEGHKGSEARV